MDRNFIRHELYSDYLKELEAIRGLPFPDSPDDKWFWCQDYINSDYSNWIDIFSDGLQVGFLIIDTAPDCHPKCNYFIAQSFIMPEYRKKHLMTDAVQRFVTEHGGKYCLMIIDKNSYARDFWFKLFDSLGYESFPGTRVFPEARVSTLIWKRSTRSSKHYKIERSYAGKRSPYQR